MAPSVLVRRSGRSKVGPTCVNPNPIQGLTILFRRRRDPLIHPHSFFISTMSGPNPTATTTTTTPGPTNRDNTFVPSGKLKNDGSNFHIWSSQLKLILRCRELWGIVTGTEVA